MKNNGLNITLIFAANFLATSFGQNCPSEGIAYFPIEDCTKYKLCVNGMSSIVECPGGLYFNPDLNNCDLPENVPECVEGRRNVLTKCAQTINAFSGAIEHKLNESYESGELCVFILRHNYSTNPGFRFMLETHGITDMDDNSISIFSMEKSWNPGYLFTRNFLGPPSLVPVLNVPGFVAVVVFKPITNSGTGFKLRFKATGDLNPTPGYNDGSDVVYNDKSNYPDELSSLASCSGVNCLDVFVATGSKLISDPALQLNLTLTLDSMSIASNRTCFEIFSHEYNTFNFVSDQFNSCWANNGTTMRFEYETRGLLVGIITSYPGNPATGNLYLKKDADSEHN